MRKLLLAFAMCNFLAHHPVPAQPVDSGWVRVSQLDGKALGMSGLTRLEGERFLTCQGNLLRELTLESQALIPVEGDLVAGLARIQALCAIPGQPGLFLAASGAHVAVVEKMADGAFLSRVSTEHFPPAGRDLDGDGQIEQGLAFDGVDLVALDGHRVAVWAERDQGYLSWALYDEGRAGLGLGEVSSVKFKSPLQANSNERLLQVSDLKVRPNGEVVVVSNSVRIDAAGRELPARACAVVLGRFEIRGGKAAFEALSEPRVLLLEEGGYRVEGMEVGQEELLLVGDDGASSYFRRLLAIIHKRICQHPPRPSPNRGYPTVQHEAVEVGQRLRLLVEAKPVEFGVTPDPASVTPGNSGFEARIRWR